MSHAFVSKPHNYAPHRGHAAEDAIHWRQQVCSILGVPFEKLTSPAQVHGGEVVPVHASEAGCGRDGRGSAIKYVDGLVTNEPGLPLILLSADCPLVWRVRPGEAGDRCGAFELAGDRRSFHGADDPRHASGLRLRADDMLAAICPSAGPCCYEVGEDVRRIAQTKLADADRFLPRRDGRMTFDLWSANQQQLVDAGVRPENIEIAGLCSICDERFWSHRRDKATAGRSALFISLR